MRGPSWASRCPSSDCATSTEPRRPDGLADGLRLRRMVEARDDLGAGVLERGLEPIQRLIHRVRAPLADESPAGTGRRGGASEECRDDERRNDERAHDGALLHGVVPLNSICAFAHACWAIKRPIA